MTPTPKQQRQIVADLGIRCPVRRWKVHRNGNVAVTTRDGTRIWKPPKKK